MAQFDYNDRTNKGTATMLVKITHNGQTFHCSPRQAAALETLMDSNAGGFATVKGYISTSNRVEPETADITFISRFSVQRMYQRTIAALQALTLDDCMDDLRDHPKVKALSTDDLYRMFDERKASEIASMQKTLDGIRDDAHRQAHDRNYHTLADGVKVHFVSEKDDAGIKVPVLTDGLPVVESIMLNVLQVSKNVTMPGVYKVVNSGVPVLISNAMRKRLPKSCKIKAISLKDEKFDSLKIAGLEMIPEDFKGMYTGDAI
jgi:hypothetical protein